MFDDDMADPKRRGRFRHVARIKTYERLGSYLKAFAGGHLSLLVLAGGPGLGKSKMLHQACNGESCWIEGHVTPFGMYSKLYEGRDRKIIIDDVDGIYSDRRCVNMLKILCQSDPVKTVGWNASEKYLASQGLPSSFQTTSRVAIVTNDWRTLNRNVSALEDRAEMVIFEPTAAEVHAQAGLWFKDKEIYDWFGANLDRVHVPSFRLYIKAEERKKGGIEWESMLEARTKESREDLIKELFADPGLTSNEDRVREFARRGGGSRATYFNYRKKLGL